MRPFLKFLWQRKTMLTMLVMLCGGVFVLAQNYQTWEVSVTVARIILGSMCFVAIPIWVGYIATEYNLWVIHPNDKVKKK
jgi:hypothetical protein